EPSRNARTFHLQILNIGPRQSGLNLPGPIKTTLSIPLISAGVRDNTETVDTRFISCVHVFPWNTLGIGRLVNASDMSGISELCTNHLLDPYKILEVIQQFSMIQAVSQSKAREPIFC